MLKDRRTLLEREIKHKMNIASMLYLDMVRTFVTYEQSAQYELIREEIGSLQFELNQVNLLISEGYE